MSAEICVTQMQMIADIIIGDTEYQAELYKSKYQSVDFRSVDTDDVTEDEKERIISGRHREEIVKNAHLIEENSRLKYQLEKKEPRRTTALATSTGTGNTTSADSDSKTAKGTVPLEEYQKLAQRFEELHKKQQEAMQRIKYVERKNMTVMQKNKEMKERVLEWQKYLAKDHKSKAQATATAEHPAVSRTIEDHLPPPLPSSPASSTVRTPRILQGLSSPAPVSLLALSAANVPTDAPTAAVQEGVHQHGSKVPRLEPDMEDRFRDLDCVLEGTENVLQEMDIATATEVINDPREPDEEEPPDERIPSSQTEEDVMQHAEAMPPPRHVDNDDVPQVVSERSLKRKRNPSTAIHVYNDRIPPDGTPSKPFRLKEEPRSSPPLPQPIHKLLRKETFDLDELGPHPISTPHGRRFRHYASNIATLQHQRSSSVPLLKEERAEGSGLELHNSFQGFVESAAAEARALSEPFTPAHAGHKPLAEINKNARMPVHGDERTPSKRHKYDAGTLRKVHNILAESGEEDVPPTDENENLLTSKEARARINARRKAAEAVQTPAKKASNPQLATPQTADSRLKFAPLLRPSSRDGAQCEPRPKRQQLAPSTTRLRQKPISELKLSDFKPNPSYNQGYSFAFAETVRKRADRACLMGCTRPECCGSTFRALAAAAAPLSSSQEEKLLEEHLGDAYDGMQFSQMSPEERKELVLQARTRELANKHGKHRHAYERQTTPPGYWRVDFPTTQEEREDREKAAELERKLVGERWAEAMRKGGRYVFRDE